MTKCDICHKETRDLADLREGYKTDDVQQICRTCERSVNDHLWKIRAVTDGFLKTAIKRFMENRRTQKAS